MSKANFIGFIKLLRLPYWLMTGGLSLLTLLALWSGQINFYVAILTFLSLALLGSAGFSINDYFDKDSDAIVKPNRPIPHGEVSPKMAIVFSIILFALAMLSSALINWLCLLIVLVDALLLIAYSTYIKRRSGIAANILVGCLTGTAFLYGEAAGFGAITTASLSIYPVCIGTIGGNILRDILSMDGDSKVGYPTLPRKIGVKKASQVAAFFFLICAFLSPLPYLLNVFGKAYLMLMLPWSIIIISSSIMILRSSSPNNIRRNERIITMSMILLPLALIIEVFL
ncbi:MAG: UbiA family prenyltransferase [Candidatus Bathyarchaeota archaeon]|nr:UbiA family prenyltransferase [Candidatus Bathyarchaeota archaeon]MCX8177498.1 UbiA family prenyltransferase [Candidatus Bathyarchaeota archaeon]MDW8194165.1 UbiA family prenyltransferase [Nitrososphaerota archaeon]